MQDKEATIAGFGTRAAAYILDRAILLVALMFLRVPVWLISLFGSGALTEDCFLFRYSALDVLCWLLSAAYFVLTTYFSGKTLGKRVMRLRVEKADGVELRFVDVLYRETVGRFLSGIAFIGYLMVLADRKKRAFHDYLCDTRVVYDRIVFRTREKTETPSAWAPLPAALPESEPVPEPAALPESESCPEPEGDLTDEPDSGENSEMEG